MPMPGSVGASPWADETPYSGRFVFAAILLRTTSSLSIGRGSQFLLASRLPREAWAQQNDCTDGYSVPPIRASFSSAQPRPPRREVAAATTPSISCSDVAFWRAIIALPR